jgi:hypothetical protein
VGGLSRRFRAKPDAGPGASGAGASRTAQYLNSGCLAIRPIAGIVK